MYTHRGGSLFHRIRLLPSPLSDQRLTQLLRQADMVLDTFPIGSSFYFLSLAISVGTPVITLRTGTSLHSSKEDLQEMRTFLAHYRARQRLLNVTVSNPMAQYVAHYDLPYAPAISAINGFYERISMGEYFIANGTAEYFRLASALVSDRYHFVCFIFIFCFKKAFFIPPETPRFKGILLIYLLRLLDHMCLFKFFLCSFLV